VADLIRKIPISFEKIQDYQVKDTRFTQVKILVLHTGLNLNNSIFKKEVVESAASSICNTPILGFIEENDDGDDDFSDHRMGLEVKDDEIKVKYKGHAYGVIPESCNPRWEDKECDDGITRTFFCVDGLLWNKFDDSKEIYDRDLNKDQSMELSDQYEGDFDKDGHFVFTKFFFDGCCALSNGVQPAMTGAEISTNFNFSMNEIQQKLELFKNYHSQSSSTEGVDNKQSLKKGGNDTLNIEKVTAILAEYELKIDDVDLEISDALTEEKVREVAEKFSKEPEDSKDPEPESNVEQTKFATANEKRNILRDSLPNTVQRDSEGSITSETYYYLSDFDDNYIYVEKYTYVKDDGYSDKKGRLSYSFDESNLIATVDSNFEEMVAKWLTLDEYAKIEEERKETVTLREFKADTLKDQRDGAVNNIFEAFDEKLADVGEYVSLKENCADMSVEDIEERCYALVGKNSITFSASQSKKPESVVKVAFEGGQEEPVDDGYGGILASKYGK